MESVRCLNQGVKVIGSRPRLPDSSVIWRRHHGGGDEGVHGRNSPLFFPPFALSSDSAARVTSSSSGRPRSRMGLKLSKTLGSYCSHKMYSKAKRCDPARRNVPGAYDNRANDTILQDQVESISEIKPLVKISPGTAFPLGASVVENGINFALFSQHASSVVLCLSNLERGKAEESNMDAVEVVLDPHKNKTGDIWHVCVEGLPLCGVHYGYRIDGPKAWEQGHRFDSSIILIDPYAKLVEGCRLFGDTTKRMSNFFGTYDFSVEPFDWGPNYELPNIPEEDLIIYEMNVRAFTADESSGLDASIRGSYLGVIEKMPHLLELGINAVELLPVFEFDELEFQRRPNARYHMINTWGYSTINFFSPMSRYASGGGGPHATSREFKEMVKALHYAGIEVILDVVYNHTSEGDDDHPYTTSFRGIDNKVYYMMDIHNNAQLLNFSGCGNTLNCNHPVVMELILDSLRHWVTEYHVDGFRFDLASILCRGTDGAPLNAPPLVRAIAKDPVLSRCKIIAEPWDCAGLYLVGRFPNWDRWAEWNGKYRDDIRRFIKGDSGMKGSFATRISGSSDLYQVNKRKPFHSINFVIAHDGFSLYDLVSYNFKHNEDNGEDGLDGCNDNFSWNCGHEGHFLNSRFMYDANAHVDGEVLQGTLKVIGRLSRTPDKRLQAEVEINYYRMRTETYSDSQLLYAVGRVSPGETNDRDIKALRSRQMKNFHLALMISQGTPMMLMGDEYGHTRYGNNNSYGHDTGINHFLWHQLEERRSSHFRFFSEMIKFRRKHHILGRDRFLGKNDVTWHEHNWCNPDSKFLAFTLHDEEFGGDIYLAFNAHDYFVQAPIPSPPLKKCWHRVVDTNLESPEDFIPDGIPFSETVYSVAPYSSILLEAKQ